MVRGYRLGLRHVDHFWRTMSSVPSLIDRLGTPMQGSMEQFVYAHAERSTEVIADGHHLAPELRHGHAASKNKSLHVKRVFIQAQQFKDASRRA